jgi:hypothetical protein
VRLVFFYYVPADAERTSQITDKYRDSYEMRKHLIPHTDYYNTDIDICQLISLTIPFYFTPLERYLMSNKNYVIVT